MNKSHLLNPETHFAGWEKTSYLTLFGTPGPPIAAVVVGDDMMACVLYREDYSLLGDIRQSPQEVVKERLAWPASYIEAARDRGDALSERFLYFARWRLRNSELLKRGSFAGWVQAESDRAREMVYWFKEHGIEDIKEWLGVTE